MKPIDFPQSTKVLQRPSTMTDKECASLHVWSDGNQCVSCWEPTFKERLNILFGGKVWLGVLSGKTQPPVFVSGTRVFNKAPFSARCRAFFGLVVESITEAIRTTTRATKQADKQEHFLAGLVIALLAGSLVSPLYGLLLGGCAGLIKEFVDYKGCGMPEILGFVFTLLGAIVGALVAVFLMMLLEVVLPSMLM
ncbi:hypothetical protein HMPREF1981_02019 [Bacteroides pyogenes F0041]|uniref:Uncharacterized protein n=2 Tax=Bacteroides pyogenes TaxID=310300 RepID=U2DU24_9BACE|nr:hypothetical protein HMPREF1981_02019 [Bacteroides pyogenes F0041]